MTQPEERNETEVPPDERVEDGIQESKTRRGAPIDEDVEGELNAALPEDHAGGPKAGLHV